MTNVLWEIACSDDVVRHWPYTNREDAEFDAVVLDEDDIEHPCKDTVEDGDRGPCPGGQHYVRSSLTTLSTGGAS